MHMLIRNWTRDQNRGDIRREGGHTLLRVSSSAVGAVSPRVRVCRVPESRQLPGRQEGAGIPVHRVLLWVTVPTILRLA